MNHESWLAQARDIAQTYGHKYIRTEHLMLALLHQHPVLLAPHGLTPDDVAAQMRHLSRPVCAADDLLVLSPAAQRFVDSLDEVPPPAILRALLRNAPLCRRLLTDLHVSVDELLGENEHAE